MECPKCKKDNIEGAKFCRYCGFELGGKINIMDRFPNYNFVPTNLIDWKKPWFARLRTIIFSIFFIASFSVLCYSIASYFSRYSYVESYRDTDYYGENEKQYYRGHVNDNFFGVYSRSSWRSTTESEARNDALRYYNEDIIGVTILSFILLLISLLTIIYGKRKYPQKTNHLNNYADYVQKYRYSGFIRGRKAPILKFYVKDNHMGLLDVAHYCVFLSAQYDRLEWREKDKYLNARTGDREFIIDIYGKELK